MRSSQQRLIWSLRLMMGHFRDFISGSRFRFLSNDQCFLASIAATRDLLIDQILSSSMPNIFRQRDERRKEISTINKPRKCYFRARKWRLEALWTLQKRRDDAQSFQINADIFFCWLKIKVMYLKKIWIQKNFFIPVLVFQIHTLKEYVFLDIYYKKSIV